MPVLEESHWSFSVVKGGSYSRTLAFSDDAGDPEDVSATDPRILVKYGPGGSESIEWTVADGQLAPLGGIDSDKIVLSLTTEEIEAFEFKVASIYFFLNGEDDLLFAGTVQVK